MEQVIKIFENEEFGKVRTVVKDGEQEMRLTLMLTTKTRHSPRFRAGVLRVLRIR